MQPPVTNSPTAPIQTTELTAILIAAIVLIILALAVALSLRKKHLSSVLPNT